MISPWIIIVCFNAKYHGYFFSLFCGYLLLVPPLVIYKADFRNLDMLKTMIAVVRDVVSVLSLSIGGFSNRFNTNDIVVGVVGAVRTNLSFGLLLNWL